MRWLVQHLLTHYLWKYLGSHLDAAEKMLSGSVCSDIWSVCGKAAAAGAVPLHLGRPPALFVELQLHPSAPAGRFSVCRRLLVLKPRLSAGESGWKQLPRPSCLLLSAQRRRWIMEASGTEAARYRAHSSRLLLVTTWFNFHFKASSCLRFCTISRNLKNCEKGNASRLRFAFLVKKRHKDGTMVSKLEWNSQVHPDSYRKHAEM